ncbi:ribonuclease HIII [Spiroplasma floricola]|uniref:Ribonuclease n=1 Tax=Spiroplasma floricola 23-6 TaxID=1336749 RepID=A0A2K8SEH1_9MOLU|nr:ribonuclease HIII [Spiroplasma floricola]AUB31857.1 ribonuclease HIII [Spiroplasma floricola 23-6]
MNNKSFKRVNEEVINKIVNENQNFLYTSKNKSIKYLFKLPYGLVVNIYKTNTILLQGEKIEEFASKYLLNSDSDKNKSTLVKKIIELPNIGCDEVGVGDFFGPLITCCAFVEKDFLKKYPLLIKEIVDSKKITDLKIINLFEQIKDKVIWEVYILDNSNYNKAYDIYKNTHKLKAICHNQALKKLLKNNINLKDIQIIMDQFVDEKNYYKYLLDQKVVIKDIYFETKAESKYISVACASIIARYHFLKEIKRLEKEFQVKLPLGANNHVKDYVNRYKIEKKDIVDKFTKLHFNSKI